MFVLILSLHFSSFFLVFLYRIVFEQDVGDGWWEGTNQNGMRGLFPEAYVEVSVSLIELYKTY